MRLFWKMLDEVGISSGEGVFRLFHEHIVPHNDAQAVELVHSRPGVDRQVDADLTFTSENTSRPAFVLTSMFPGTCGGEKHSCPESGFVVAFV